MGKPSIRHLVWESPPSCLVWSSLYIPKEISPEYSLEGLMLKLKLQSFGLLMWRADSLEKTLMLGKIEGRRRRERQRMMVGWNHQLNGYEFEWTPGVGDGQGGLVCCDSWGHKESDTTEWLKWTEKELYEFNRNLNTVFLLVVCSSVCSLIDLKELTYNFQIPSSERE